MIGAIIGDISGSRYEFDNTSDYNFPVFSDKNDYTDDTICTVAVAEAIMNGKDYADTMKKWCRKYPHPMGEYGGYFYQWIMSEDKAPYNSYGNGSAMRVSPVPWLFDSEEMVRKEAEASARITHSHPEGIKGAVAVATAIFRMRKSGKPNLEILEEVAKEFYGESPFSNLPERGVFDVTCQGCVPLALNLCRGADNFEDAIRKAVTYGGDSDTLAAIVGSLAEAAFGVPSEMEAKALSYLPNEMKEIYERFCEKRNLNQ